MLGVTLSKDARARSLQLPAWNEALGLPRPWDQQWSLRMQQVLAYETDLLEYDDIFDGSHVIEASTAELIEAPQAELDEVLALGGAFAAIDELKGRLVTSNTERVRRIESGEQVVVGVNRFTETASSPLDGDEIDPEGRPRGARPRPSGSCTSGGPSATPTPSTRALDELRRVAVVRRQRHAGHHRPRPRRRHHRRVGRRAARGVRRVPRPHRRGRGRRASARCPADLRAVADRVRAMRRRAAPPPGRQARARRALQRRRADRGGRPRRRHGGHLPGHPPDARADRGRGPRRGRRRDRPVDPVGQPPRAGARRGRPPPGRGRRRARSSSAASSPRPTDPRCSPPASPRVYTPKDFELGRIMGDIADLVAADRSR